MVKGFEKMSRKISQQWYETTGWKSINNWLTEMASRGISKIYLQNLEVVPDCIDSSALIQAFNQDSSTWEMMLDSEDDLVIRKK